MTDRDGRLSTQLDHVAIRRWHATITARRPDTGLGVDMIPIIDLGVFRSRKAAKDRESGPEALDMEHPGLT